VKMDPFIEAEEAAGHSVKHCCDLFEVSRAAYYERKKDVPSATELADAELTEKIIAVHAESKGTAGSTGGCDSHTGRVLGAGAGPDPKLATGLVPCW
jgi:hypothetical protein